MKMSVSWAARRRVLLAAFGGLALTAGLVPGSPAAAEDQNVDVSLRYACESAPGQQITVRVRNTFPSTGKVGEPVEPGKATVAVTLPAAVLGDLAEPGTADVTGTVDLGMLVSPTPPTSADWTGLAVTRAPARDGERLTFTASGQVPPVQVSAGGPMVFSAAQLTLTLKPGKAGGSTTPAGPMSLVCLPGLGQNSTVATVSVPGGEEPPKRETPQPRSVAPRVLNEKDFCPDGPETEPDLQYLPEEEKKFIRDGDPSYQVFPSPVSPGCAMAYGHSNVSKLDGAARTTATAYVLAGQRVAVNIRVNYLSQLGSGTLYPDPIKSTFLAYGFMPTSATIEMVPVEQMNILYVTPINNLPGSVERVPRTTIYTKVVLRVRDVRVNGVPLEVGDDCRSARPMEVVLQGERDSVPRYLVDEGGVVQGHVDIPPFTGCGVGEDLDGLLTSSISGPGNYLRMVQGPLCAPEEPAAADNPLSPCPMQRYGWTFEPEGEFTATASSLRLVNDRNGATITCGSAVMRGSLPGFVPKTQDEVRLTDFSASGCVGDAPQTAGPFDFSVTGSQRYLRLATFDETGGRSRGLFTSFTFNILPATGCRISAATGAASALGFEYDNAAHVFEFKPGVLVNDLGLTLRSGGSTTGTRCGDLYKPGDSVKIAGNFVVDKPLKIRKP